jgi:hypothetical protein
MSSYARGSMPTGGFGSQPQRMVQQPGKQLGGSFGPQNIKYANPMQPQVQQPMGGFPGMGRQGLPSGMMQHIQQLQQLQQQQMPPMRPQKPVSAARQYLDAVKQYRQGGSQGPRPLYSQFKQQQMQPQPQQLGGMPGQQLGGMGQPMDQQRQVGMMPSPEMQAYRAQDAANQAQRSQMMQGLQGAGQGPSPMSGTPNYGQPPMTQPPAGGFGAAPQPMTQPPAGGYGPGVNNYSAPQRQPMAQPYTPNANQIKPANPMMPQGMNMGGSVGMAPPNPYAQQVGQEDPRMQAMRYMQQMNFGG